MTRLLRKLAYYYREGGVGASFAGAVDYAHRMLWSDSVWVVYACAAAAQPPGSPDFLTRRELGLQDLLDIGYSKARTHPEEIRKRFDRRNICHAFYMGDRVATIGWSSPGYLELDRDVEFPCAGAAGLFDFITFAEFRSRGCYTNALLQLCAATLRNGLGTAYIAADPGNVPSIKGIERAGFRPVTTVRRSLRFGRRAVREQRGISSARGGG